ncbi:MAG TPA: hypothetical protein PLA33_04945, partial [Ottowia sp.]|nr:hypothetical protein [Ottowia sp.]
MPDLQPKSRAIGQKAGEKWAAAVDLQPTISKSDSLPGSLDIEQAARLTAARLADRARGRSGGDALGDLGVLLDLVEVHVAVHAGLVLV